MTTKKALELFLQETKKNIYRKFKHHNGFYFIRVKKVTGLKKLTNAGSQYGEAYSILIGFEVEDNGFNREPIYKEYVSTSFNWFNEKPIVDSIEFKINNKRKKEILEILKKSMQ